jgi:hypothetical protein
MFRDYTRGSSNFAGFALGQPVERDGPRLLDLFFGSGANEEPGVLFPTLPFEQAVGPCSRSGTGQD